MSMQRGIFPLTCGARKYTRVGYTHDDSDL